MCASEIQHGDLVRTVLEVAVPLWMLRLGDLAPEWAQTQAAYWTTDAVTEIEDRRDLLLNGGGEGHDLAETLNILARGLAAAAGAPGGVQFLGDIWCSQHSPGGRRAETWESLCRWCVSYEEPVNDSTDPVVVARVGLRRALLAVTPERRYPS